MHTITRTVFVLCMGVTGLLMARCSSEPTQQQPPAECPTGDCKVPSCTDGIKNGTESDRDCGGSCAVKCGAMAACATSADCQSALMCSGGSCVAPTCKDSVKNGDETDTDCGGTGCMPCGTDATCRSPSDCTSGLCTGGRCPAPSCTDGVKNGTESDVDCGGSCGACTIGKVCSADSDCAPWLCPGINEVPEGTQPRCGLGTGKDQALSVPAGMTVTINSGASAVTGTLGASTATVATPAAFAQGQIVFFHQTQGTGAGANEFNQVVGTSGGTLMLKRPLSRAYTTGAQAVIVPQYLSVSVAAGGTLTAPAWDGSQGGILVFQSAGAITVSGTVTMAGKGFRGAGRANVCFPSSPSCTVNHGRTGESEAGPSAFSTLNANAEPVNNGGGGAGGSRGQDCAAGGGGSYGTAGTNGTNGSLGVCLVVAGKHLGGLPGAVLGSADLLPSIFLGPAGGEGGPDEDGAYPGFGGSGGGLIVASGTSLTVDAATGSVTASGSNGGDGSNTGPCGGAGGGMGNGGGGAGGGIRVHVADSASVGTGRVVSAGGSGGAAGSCGATYPGGRGGLGRIQIRAGGTFTGTTNPAAYQM